MPLNYTPKGQSANASPQPTTPVPKARPQISYGQPTPSSARAEALKARLTGKPVPQPAPPRRAGSTARAEQFSQLQNQAVPIAPPPKPIGQSTARQMEAPKNFPAQPSGLDPQAQLSPPDNSIEATAPAEAPSEPMSPQFVALAKQSQQIRKAQRDLQAAKEAWKLEQAKYVPIDKLKSETLKTLSEAGITYDSLVESQLNQVAPDPQQHLLDEIEALKAKLAGVDEKFVSRDKQAYDAAVNQIRNDVKLLVDSDPAYETIKATEQSEDVVELIKRVFDAEGNVLPVEEACRMIEDKLVDREFERVQRLSNLSKIKSRMVPPAEILEEATTLQPQPPKTTTLTNQGSVQRTLTPRERAMRAFETARQPK